MKRFLALLLALAMLFCLAACNNVDNNDEENNENNDDVLTLPSAKVGLAIQDLDALLELFAGADPELGIENLYVEMGTDEDAGLLSLGATVQDKDYNVNLFLGEALILSAPELLDENYGISMADLPGWYASMMTSVRQPAVGTDSAFPPATYDSVSSSNSVLGMLETVDTEAVAALVEKYCDLLISELKAADGISTSTEDGKTVLTGTLNGDAFATICVNIIETLFSDDDFFSLLADASGMSADEIKQNATSGKPSKDELLDDAKEAFNGVNLSLAVNEIALDSDNMAVAVDLKLTLTSNGENGSIAFAYDVEAMTLAVNVDVPGAKLNLSVGNGKFDFSTDTQSGKVAVHFETNDSGFSGYMEQNGQKMMEVSLSYTDTEMTFKLNVQGSEMVLNAKISDTTAEGTMTMDGQEMAKVLFDREVDGSKETLTLNTITVQGQSVDFSDAGISFYVDNGFEMPEAPEYTDITTLDADDFEAIGEAFAEDNADLFEIFSGLGTPSYDSDSDYDDWDDYGDWDENYDYY